MGNNVQHLRFRAADGFGGAKGFGLLGFGIVFVDQAVGSDVNIHPFHGQHLFVNDLLFSS